MGVLLTQDGTILRGKSFGAQGESFGELVFNTSITGYQEIITDPSYASQMVVMTYPEIGNYGINQDDFEAIKPHFNALIVKNYCKKESHYKSEKTLSDYLKEHDIVALEGLDTRELTKKIRESGTMNAYVNSNDICDVEINKKIGELQNYKHNPDIVLDVTTGVNYKVGEGNPIKLAFIDYGAKLGIINSLVKRGCEVNVFRADVSAQTIIDGDFDALFLSNGPGDPSDCKLELSTIKELIGRLPIFGICLGYQLLALALNGKTYKLKYGHRGGNHPIKNILTNKVFMSSQNHGYALCPDSLTELVQVSHINLNDDTLEGFIAPSLKIYAVQFHPEANPGPEDSSVIFDEWVELMKKYQKVRV